MDELSNEVLHTNMPPTADESDYVRRLMLERQREALDLERQYRIAHAALQDISARQQQTQRDIKTLTAVLAPMRRIPLEILAGEIFPSCVEIGKSDYMSLGRSYTIDDPRTAPMVLTHVCAVWRDVAVNSPRLWDHLLFHFPRRFAHRRVPMIDTLVHRSNPHPITVAIHSDSYMHNCALPILPALMSLPQFRERVEALDINHPIIDFQRLLGLSRPVFPLLRILVLNLGMQKYGYGRPALGTVLEFFSSSPRLYRLGVLAGTMDPIPVTFASNFPWSQLTDLRMSPHLDFSTACAILSRCTKLQICAFETLESSSPSHLGHTTCTLPDLQELTLRTNSGGSSSSFFIIFTFPNLRKLDLDLFDWPEDGLFDLQQRSRFTLTHLSLRNVGLGAAALTRFLVGNPTIEQFCLAEFRDQGIVTALTYHPSQSSILLPRLKDLRIRLEFSDILVEEGEDLVNMLKSRCVLPPNNATAFAPLETIELHISGPPLSADAEVGIWQLECMGILHNYMPRE
ncbi:hypothetical protein B0H13DRAFT_2185855 [Mycena leptocephala]|nr:hypothetical protein B0H13DRAFT_2185855 [Mycena leptocephala]